MIIFRKLFNTQNEEERLFADSKINQLNNLLSLTEGTAMEILKLIEFKKICGDDGMINHWIDVASGNLVNQIDSTIVRYNMAFAGALGDKDLDNLFSSGDKQKIRAKYKTQSDYITAVKNRLRNETKGGSYKYRDWLKANDVKNRRDDYFLVSNKDYIKFFKFLTLSLSGNIDPNDYEGWKILSDSELMRMEISPNPKLNKNNCSNLKNKIKEILRVCIEKMAENINYPVAAQSQRTKNK